ncbi:MAG: tyrosine-protein phosphatase [Oscillospiraceae bacterium]
MQSLTNFRDLGGMAAANGKITAKHRLLRCGEPVNVSEEDKKTLLSEYKLANIIDFRSDKEAKETPIDTFVGVKYYNIDVLENDARKSSSREAFASDEPLANTEGYLAHLYNIMIADKFAQKGYRKFIDILLAQKNGASLFHCFAGKDRTGLAAAIILTILGVSQEDIFSDYLKSNEQRREYNAIMINEARQNGASEAKLKAMGIALGVQRSFLQASYTAAETQYGSFGGYVRNGVGVTEEEISILQSMYLD